TYKLQLHIQGLCNLPIGFEEAVNLTTKISNNRRSLVVVLEEFNVPFRHFYPQTVLHSVFNILNILNIIFQYRQQNLQLRYVPRILKKISQYRIQHWPRGNG